MLRLASILLMGALVAFPAAAGLGKHRGGGSGPPQTLSDEEFVGPFASWMCAASAASGKCGTAAAAFCNADSTGVSDATTAIQTCINSLSSTQSVIYFPCGTYNISATLTIAAQSYAGLIGQDNSTVGGRCTTTLKWTGSSGGKMIYMNGTIHTQLTRLTFDGNNLANILVDQSWDSSTGGFDTGDQYIDDVFKNGNDVTTSYAIRCGALGAGCAEVTILRDTFSNLGWGVSLCNSNALDVWVWYSSFTNMNNAINNGNNDIPGHDSNCPGASGAYHAIGNVFSASAYGDLHVTSSGSLINALDNYTSGSTRFIDQLGHITLQRNTIINTNVGVAASVSDQDYPLLLDNTFENTNSTSPYGYGPLGAAIGNSYTNSTPYFGTPPPYRSGELTISYAPPGPPTLPGTLPNNSRVIYEASPSGSGVTCSSGLPCSVQTAICKASNGAGSTFSGVCSGSPDSMKNVAHLPAGSYTVSATLTVPANSNLQVIGDGWNTLLSSTTANPALLINGPSHATVRDLWIHGNFTTSDGVHITNADQVGGYVYIRDSRFSANNTASLTMNGMSNVLVNAADFVVPYNTSTFDIFESGSIHFNRFFGSQGSYSLSGAANAEHVGPWIEYPGSGPLIATNISGTGSFVSSAHRFGDPSNNINFTLNNFTGTFAVLNANVTSDTCPYSGSLLQTTGSSSGALAIVGLNNVMSLTPISNGASSTLKVFGNNATQCVMPDTPVADVPSPITSGDMATVASALSYFRTTKPLVPQGTGSGITGVEFYNVIVDTMSTAMQIAP